MTMFHCPLPLARTARPGHAANHEVFHDPAISPAPQPPGLTLVRATQPLAHNVRLLRNHRSSDRALFALSGKLSDVCAALDQLARQEALYGMRRATL